MLLFLMLCRFRALSVRNQQIGEHGAGGRVLGIEHMSVKRRKLHGGVESRSRCPANEQGSSHPSGRHLLADLLHLVK